MSTTLFREDEMLHVHIGGKYAYTLYFPSPAKAQEFFDVWQQKNQTLNFVVKPKRSFHLHTQDQPELT